MYLSSESLGIQIQTLHSVYIYLQVQIRVTLQQSKAIHISFSPPSLQTFHNLTNYTNAALFHRLPSE